MTMRLGVVMCVVAAASLAGAAQTSERAQGPTFRTGVDLVTVDVAVVDGRGRPVEDLRAPEFSVKIDGETRRVVSAELVKVDLEAAKKQVADKSETFYTSNVAPLNGRRIVIAVDQVNIRPGSLRLIMSAASRFLDRLSPLDQVAFVTFPEPGPSVSFTSDKLKLRFAMESLIGHPPRVLHSQYNIGVTEALAITNRHDQVVLAEVLKRECLGQDPSTRSQCERDVLTHSGEITRRLREDVDQSVLGLRQLLERLALFEGPKSMILLSEGLAVDDQSELRSLVQLAGAARTSINVMVLDLRRGDVTLGEQSPTELQDERYRMQGLAGLAMMSLGSLFHVAGTGEPIFDRLSSEISAYYLLGVEQRPSDSTGDRHRIDVEVRRRDVTIRSRQAFVLSPTAGPRRSAGESLRAALASPFAVSGVPLRVTTFAHQDPSSTKIRLVLAAQVGQPGAPKGEYAVGYLLINDEHRIVASHDDTRMLTPAGASPNESLEFVSTVAVDPGIYSLRFGVVDSEGRRGTVVRGVNAWKMAGETLAIGDLVVGNVPAQGQSLLPAVEPHVASDAVATYVEIYSSSASTFDGAAVTFEIADDADSPALTAQAAQLTVGLQPTSKVATGVVGVRALPPGRYVARAQILRDGKTVGILARPFVLEREAAALTMSPAAIAAASKSFASTLPKFDRDAVLARDLIGPLLDVVGRRSPTLTGAMVEARARRYGAAALEAFEAGDQTAAAFLRGVDFYAKGQLAQAVTQLSIAAGPRREFFPAAVFLGASFAATGRDRDAAGVWQMALGTEPRPTAVYLMVADARLRDGQLESAVEILKPVYDRQPTDDQVGKRLAMAYVLSGRYADAVSVLDGYLGRHPTDHDLLLGAVLAHYELVRAGQTLSNVDRANLRRYSAAYKGPESALVEKYLAAMQAAP